MFGWMTPSITKKYRPTKEFTLLWRVDEFNRPIPIPDMEPETELEIERHAAALRRKELSLILSGRMKPSESVELKKLFQEPS